MALGKCDQAPILRPRESSSQVIGSTVQAPLRSTEGKSRKDGERISGVSDEGNLPPIRGPDGATIPRHIRQLDRLFPANDRCIDAGVASPVALPKRDQSPIRRERRCRLIPPQSDQRDYLNL